MCPTLLTLVVVILYSVVFGDPSGLALGVNIMVAAIAAVGLTLAIGSAGQLALGQAGFMAIGAYGTAYLMLDKGWNFLSGAACQRAAGPGPGDVLSATSLCVCAATTSRWRRSP